MLLIMLYRFQKWLKDGKEWIEKKKHPGSEYLRTELQRSSVGIGSNNEKM